ncbi:solute carrier family 22 member 20-like [Podarcis raffonei]|uniref:solute carrier family 22 member 20-like n=1 Tax=Podarcis raffonei TaxID=65483 RepID=UPI00232945DE|nr:solute carrier family 22 member 20-like [Podarcis raffonei]
MAFNDVLESIGGVGRFQILQITFLLISVCLIGCHNFLQNFTAAIPDHHCKAVLPTNQTLPSSYTQSTAEGVLLKAPVPIDQNWKPEKCLQFAMSWWRLLSPNATVEVGDSATQVHTELCTGGWVYDVSVFKSTIVTEVSFLHHQQEMKDGKAVLKHRWNLVCDLQNLRDVAQSLYMAGVLVGAGVFGVLSDRWVVVVMNVRPCYATRPMPGMSREVWISLRQGTIDINVLSALYQQSAYGAWGFLHGSQTVACDVLPIKKCSSWFLLQVLLTVSLASLLVLEWMPNKGRTVAGALLGYFVTFGQIVLAGVAYGVRNWRWLQLSVSAPFFIIFVCSWKLPESPRWLLLHNKAQVAVQNLRKVAAINGKSKEGEKINKEARTEGDRYVGVQLETTKASICTLSSGLRPLPRPATFLPLIFHRLAQVLHSHMQMEAASLKSQRTVFDLFRSPILRRVTCCLMVVWFSSSFSYYGLAMDVQKFGLNIFVVQVLFGAIDLPVVLLSTLAMVFIGRRLTMAGFLSLAGLLVFINMFVPDGKLLYGFLTCICLETTRFRSFYIFLLPAELQTLRTVQAALGKGCLASSFIGAYLYSGELYPTEIRQTGMGSVSMQARLGAMVAPLVYVLRDSFPVLPSIIFGAAPLLAGVSACFLMETRHLPLLETIAEMECRSRNVSSMETVEEICLQQVERSLFKESV